MLQASRAAPSAELVMEAVYGFNNLLAGSTLLATAKGKLVYAAAAVVVVHDPASNTQVLQNTTTLNKPEP